MPLSHLRDVSNWQAPADWKREKKEVAALYSKVSQGLSYTDPTGQKRLRDARSHGIPAGGYHFCTPGVGRPEQQADRLLALSPLRPGALRPCLDCEANPLSLSNAQLAAWYLGAVVRVHRRTGLWPVIYGPPYYLESFATYHHDPFARCPLWVAHYGVKHPKIPSPWMHAAAWQWTQTFRDPAVGRVDDSFLFDLGALRIPWSWKPLTARLRR